MRSWGAFALLVALAPVTACFAGYDSRWGEAKRAQKRVAADSKPATISPSSDDDSARGARQRTVRVRVRPNARYLAETVDAPKQVADLIEDANGVLSATLACRLELDRLEPWSRDVDEVPEAALAALRADDAGEGVDLVAGMIGALPRQTDSLHLVGVANPLGKHVVVRAASRLDEHEAIDKGFYELSEDDRMRLIRARKRHRALAVFLHEVGHALGALHENDRRSLMYPTYDAKMSGFGGGAVSLMRIALDETDPAKVARGQLALLRGSMAAEWIVAERDQRIASLEAMLPAPAEAPTERRGLAQTAAGPTPPAELRGDDRERFTRAWEKFQAGDAKGAHEAAKPLYAQYPAVYAVQDLRCQLAMLRWLDRAEVTAECAPLKSLSPAGDAGAR